MALKQQRSGNQPRSTCDHQPTALTALAHHSPLMHHLPACKNANCGSQPAEDRVFQFRTCSVSVPKHKAPCDIALFACMCLCVRAPSLVLAPRVTHSMVTLVNSSVQIECDRNGGYLRVGRRCDSTLLFVACLFTCLFACLFVCLFVCDASYCSNPQPVTLACLPSDHFKSQTANQHTSRALSLSVDSVSFLLLSPLDRAILQLLVSDKWRVDWKLQRLIRCVLRLFVPALCECVVTLLSHLAHAQLLSLSLSLLLPSFSLVLFLFVVKGGKCKYDSCNTGYELTQFGSAERDCTWVGNSVQWTGSAKECEGAHQVHMR